MSQENSQLVSDGLQQSPLCHKFATFLPQVKLEYPLNSCDHGHLHHEIFNDLAPLATDLGLRFARTLKRYDYEQAHQELIDIHQSLRIQDLNLCDNTEELQFKANAYAARCRLFRQQFKNLEQAYHHASQLVKRYQLSPPNIKQGDLIPALNRMCCEHWWFRKIKVLRLRKIEAVARNIELVNSSRSEYASYHAIKLNRQQKAQNRHYLSSTQITNENGETYTLQELADRSVSNPAIRRAELMVRIRGFEEVAKLLGHVGEFYTLTAPSRMHACLKRGVHNPKYDKTTPKQAQDYFTHIWALMRSELYRQGINLYGFRVVEPHHDGTPHWHLLLFMPNEQRETVRSIMRHYAFLDTPNELGAKDHRFKAISIDPNKGTAAGYIAKYIAKNIDGYGLNQTPDDKTAIETAERITTWANTWGIRQFQQIGGPSVTVWRQLRRLDKVEDQELEQARTAATASDWAAFMLAMGGIDLSKKNHLIKPYYNYGWHINQETGEIIQTTHNRYQESNSQRIVGVISKGIAYDSRKHFWTVSKNTPPFSPEEFLAHNPRLTVPSIRTADSLMNSALEPAKKRGVHQREVVTALEAFRSLQVAGDIGEGGVYDQIMEHLLQGTDVILRHKVSDLQDESCRGNMPTSTALDRLRKANATLGIPLVELLKWYKNDLTVIETDPYLTDSQLDAYVQDYAKRHWRGWSSLDLYQ